MKYEDLPDHYWQSIGRATKILQAHYLDSQDLPFPLELKEYLIIPEWQKAAAMRIIATAFKKLDLSSIKNRPPEEALGMMLGIVTSAVEFGEEMEDFQIENTNLVYLPDAFRDLEDLEDQEIPDDLLERAIDSLPIDKRSGYYRSYADGLVAVSEDGESLRHGSDATELYFAMLTFSETIHFLSTWKEVHEFISTGIPQYKVRFQAMRKALERIGFSPKEARN